MEIHQSYGNFRTGRVSSVDFEWIFHTMVVLYIGDFPYQYANALSTWEIVQSSLHRDFPQIQTTMDTIYTIYCTVGLLMLEYIIFDAK